MLEHDRKIKFRKTHGTGKNAPQYEDRFSNSNVAKSNMSNCHP